MFALRVVARFIAAARTTRPFSLYDLFTSSKYLLEEQRLSLAPEVRRKTKKRRETRKRERDANSISPLFAAFFLIISKFRTRAFLFFCFESWSIGWPNTNWLFAVEKDLFFFVHGASNFSSLSSFLSFSLLLSYHTWQANIIGEPAKIVDNE